MSGDCKMNFFVATQQAHAYSRILRINYPHLNVQLLLLVISKQDSGAKLTTALTKSIHKLFPDHPSIAAVPPNSGVEDG